MENLLLLLCFISLIIMACGQVTCEGSTVTISSCGPGLAVKFSNALFTRLNSDESSPWCRSCCFCNDRSNTGADYDIWHTDAYYASGLYRVCGSQTDLTFDLTAYCQQKQWGNNDNCVIPVSGDFWNQITNTIVQDPCTGVYKYLVYEYSSLNENLVVEELLF